MKGSDYYFFGQGYLLETFGNTVTPPSKEDCFLKLGYTVKYQKIQTDVPSLALLLGFWFLFTTAMPKEGATKAKHTVNAQRVTTSFTSQNEQNKMTRTTCCKNKKVPKRKRKRKDRRNKLYLSSCSYQASGTFVFKCFI